MTGKQLASHDAMDRDQVWQVIDAQRLSLAGLLEQLSADEWQQPSLCTGWTVRDVAAHLTLQQIGLGGAIGMMVRWRGSLDRTIHDAACRRAAHADRTDHRPDPGLGRFPAPQHRGHLPRDAH